MALKDDRAKNAAKIQQALRIHPDLSRQLDATGRARQDGLTPAGVQPALPLDEPATPALDSMTLAELAALREDVEQAITRAVRQMRSFPAGESWRQSTWADIGRHLGISRQAAQQRYGAGRSK